MKAFRGYSFHASAICNVVGIKVKSLHRIAADWQQNGLLSNMTVRSENKRRGGK